jgi:hypothetical protein
MLAAETIAAVVKGDASASTLKAFAEKVDASYVKKSCGRFAIFSGASSTVCGPSSPDCRCSRAAGASSIPWPVRGYAEMEKLGELKGGGKTRDDFVTRRWTAPSPSIA